jgi:hypothetical protein
MTKEKILYHVSPKKLDLFTVLAPSGTPHLDPAIEALLDSCRPDSSIPRSEAVYLSETPEASRHGLRYDEGYVHLVEPVGDVQRRDNNWIGQLQIRHHTNSRFARFKDKRLNHLSDVEMATKYFAGEASPNPNWEIVARSAQVKGLLSDHPVPLRSDSLERWLKNATPDLELKNER